MPSCLKKRAAEKGDTLVEVLVAITVLSIVMVGAFSLMNRGVAQMYDSMEKSEVRLLLNRQIESLTYARDQYLLSQLDSGTLNSYDQAALAVWTQLKTAGYSTATIPALDLCTGTPQNAFWIVPDASNRLSVVSSNTSGALTSVTADGFPAPGDGIWIQKIDSLASAQVPYKDFYIRACWRQNSSPKTQVLSTVVRLYDR